MGKRSDLLKSEGGQLVIYVIVLLLLAALIVPPLLGLTYSGLRAAAMGHEKMQRFYAADTGVENAIYEIINRGNETDPNPRVPILFGSENATTFSLTGVNGCNVDIVIEREEDLIGNVTYIITSTATDLSKGTRAKVQAEVTLNTEPMTRPVVNPKPNPPGNSPFSYAVANLGQDTVIIQAATAENQNSAIAGDIYSGGDLIIDTNVQIVPNLGNASSVYADGNIEVGVGSIISGNALANGNIHLLAGAQIGYDAYGNGTIVLDTAAKIGNSSYASGTTTLNNFSEIGGSSWADGDISVLHDAPTPQHNIQTVIHGNASSNQDIIVDGTDGGPARINGNASAVGSIQELNGGDVLGAIDDDAVPFELILPPLPDLIDPVTAYWQSFYYQEAHGLEPEWPDENYPTLLSDPHPVEPYESGPYEVNKENDGTPLGDKHITGYLKVVNKATLNLSGTVYVDGYIDIDNMCSVIGSGKLVATGNINMWNNNIGSNTTLPLFMSINGDILEKNNSVINAVLYAPNGTVEVGTDTHVYGSVVGESINVKNFFSAMYDQRVMDIPGLPSGNVTNPGSGWEPGAEPYIIYTGANIEWYHVIE